MSDKLPGHNFALVDMITRWEDLDENKREIGGQQKEIMAEMKSLGYDTVAIREVLRRRKKDREQVEEIDSMVQFYEKELEE